MSLAIATTRIPGLETANKIIRFLTFPAGWKYGAGEAPSPLIVKMALSVNRTASMAGLETDAFLGVDGEVRVTVYHRLTYLQFTIEEDGLIEYVREDGNEEVERIPKLSLERALSILGNFELELWHSSVSSTVRTTIPIEDAFKTLPSRLPGAVRVFRSLGGIAPFELALQSADM